MNIRNVPLTSCAPNESGAVLIEAAIILPIILMIFLAMTEISHAIFEYRTIVAQVQVAARYLSTQAPGNNHANAICLVKYGTLPISGQCSGSIILPGLSTATVQVEDATNNTTLSGAAVQTGSDILRINLVRVSVTSYKYDPIVAQVLSEILIGPSMTFNSISSTRRQIL